jgi:hypothetical protein
MNILGHHRTMSHRRVARYRKVIESTVADVTDNQSSLLSCSAIAGLLFRPLRGERIRKELLDVCFADRPERLAQRAILSWRISNRKASNNHLGMDSGADSHRPSPSGSSSGKSTHPGSCRGSRCGPDRRGLLRDLFHLGAAHGRSRRGTSRPRRVGPSPPGAGQTRLRHLRGIPGTGDLGLRGVPDHLRPSASGRLPLRPCDGSGHCV